jgi:myo-inositol 2-dehydrogenase/D-chiro-inositol 1-dehydrogenase
MRLVVIGCGEHAESSHGPAQARYAARHRDLDRAACCDLDPARAERYRERFGFARSYTDALAMLEAERPDAVVLVVPAEVTAGLASRILERGFPLLLEKPPGRTVQEVDCMIAAVARAGRPAPHQVAFNRRFVPLLREARRRLAALAVTHVHYEMTRVDRLDPDLSTTAIHGIDAVRFLAGSDYEHARFRYADSNIFVDAELATGATAHLAFCPLAGAVLERATVHARDHTLLVRIPMWGGPDSPGRLEHFERGRLLDAVAGAPDEPFVLGGFYGEYEAFLGDLAAGRAPSPGLAESRQSVEIADCIRRRESEYRA